MYGEFCKILQNRFNEKYYLIADKTIIRLYYKIIYSKKNDLQLNLWHITCSS